MLILNTEKISKHFDGVYAVKGLSVGFEKGKITGLIGPNGSGKSTLVNILTGLFPFNAGKIVIAGTTTLEDIESHEILSYKISRTFQEVRLFEQMPVLDNILVVLTNRNVWGAIFEKHTKYHLEIAEEILKKIGLWDKRNELASNLSYGRRKLLEIGRTIAVDAEITFYDEPFAGLFPEMVKKVSDILLELKAKGKTIVLIEHNMDLIRGLSDKIIVLDSGELLAEGSPEKVLSEKSVIEAYLGE